MVTIGLVITVALMAGFGLIWWLAGSKSETAWVARVEVEPVDQPAVASASEEEPPVARPARHPRKKNMCKYVEPVRRSSDGTATGKHLVCVTCGLTRGRRGPFANKASLAAHMGRCKSVKANRRKGR